MALSILLAAALCLGTPPHAGEASSLSRAGDLQAAQQNSLPGQAAASHPEQAPPVGPAPANPGATPQPTAPSPPPIVVLDPAHGGTDTGARGENGLAEKDVVLQIARTLQAQLITHGFRVVMTRSDDSNPSYDERAAIANGYRNAVFITLHVGSSGKIGTIRAFYDQFWPATGAVPSSSLPLVPGAKSAAAAANPGNLLISWQEAQRPYVADSQRLADALQLQFAQLFAGSPVTSSAVPLRDLRSVANPAVAIDISSIGAPSAESLLELSGPLSIAIEKAVATFQRGQAPSKP
ncbi:MAG: N-acetylmuramoyl-L-alanine amidase [Acidobacteriota bacterium]|nr:N-acetylmuramoyl-L-alanine amidase [Acidobacteriota bacterium]